MVGRPTVGVLHARYIRCNAGGERTTEFADQSVDDDDGISVRRRRCRFEDLYRKPLDQLHDTTGRLSQRQTVSGWTN